MKQGRRGCRRKEASRGRESLKTPRSRGRQARCMSLPVSASAVGQQTPWKGPLTPRTARSRGDRSTLQQQRAGRTTLARGRTSRRAAQAERRVSGPGGASGEGWRRPPVDAAPSFPKDRCSTGGHTRNVRAIRHSRLLERDTGDLETLHRTCGTVRLTRVGGSVWTLGPADGVASGRWRHRL
jgi:hypothetical protein